MRPSSPAANSEPARPWSKLTRESLDSRVKASRRGAATLKVYLHDGAREFRVVLSGYLAGEEVQNLEGAWETAKSILAGKEVIVDTSGITGADSSGVELLCRMRDSGARMTAALPLVSRESLPADVTTAAAPRSRHKVFRRLVQAIFPGLLAEQPAARTDA